jgi:MFS transporter, ACS family, aldohexuronate transporter
MTGSERSSGFLPWLQWRWCVVLLLFLITVINYLDRQSLSLLAPMIQQKLAFPDRVYGHIVSGFLLAYTVSYLLAGYITDKLGSRRSMTIFVVWWSLAEMLPPFARSGWSLGVGRFLLGLGEAGNYVAAPKTIAEYFGAEERALAIGIYTAGATLGAALAPPLIGAVTIHFGWPVVFWSTGIVGLLWTGPWLWISRKIRQQGKISDTVCAPPALQDVSTANIWRRVIQRSDTWWLLLARCLTDPVWYFYLFWYPKYLQQERHLSLADTGHIAWVVYLAADLGTILGGWAAIPLLRRGLAILTVRRAIMAASAFMMLCSPLVVLLHSVDGSFACASLIVGSHGMAGHAHRHNSRSVFSWDCGYCSGFDCCRQRNWRDDL